MVESPATALSALVFKPITHLLVRASNQCSLRRLRGLAEGSIPVPGGRLPDRDGGSENGARLVCNPARAERERRGARFEGLARRLARPGAVVGVAAAAGATVGVATDVFVVLLRCRLPMRRGAGS